MKNKIIIVSALITMSLCSSNISKAAFPIKNGLFTKAAMIETNMPNKLVTNNSRTVIGYDLGNSNLMVTKTTPDKRAAISQMSYLYSAICGFGFIAMAINDNFHGSDWIICLILTCLFVIPGIFWALLKMRKYY